MKHLYFLLVNFLARVIFPQCESMTKLWLFICSVVQESWEYLKYWWEYCNSKGNLSIYFVSTGTNYFYFHRFGAYFCIYTAILCLLYISKGKCQQSVPWFSLAYPLTIYTRLKKFFLTLFSIFFFSISLRIPCTPVKWRIQAMN